MPADVRAAAGRRLPAHMVPSAVVVLERLPLTPNGKLDRRGLPAPEMAGGSEHVAPSTADEALVVGLFEELTGASAGVGSRQLLRARRAFAAGDASGVPSAGGDGGVGVGPFGVRGADAEGLGQR